MQRGFKMSEISSIMLKKTYGESFETVLGEYLEKLPMERKRGVKAKYKILKELPSVEVYREMKTKRFTTDISCLVDDAFDEFECLRDELQEWYDALPESFQNGDKGDALQNSVDALDCLERPDVPDEVGKFACVFFPSAKCTSRADRCSEAAGKLRAVIDRLQEALDEDDEKEEGKMEESLRSDIEQLRDDVERAADEAESVEFPGMYS
jgi:hypothetical protein